jgi:hypothetical protein
LKWALSELQLQGYLEAWMLLIMEREKGEYEQVQNLPFPINEHILHPSEMPGPETPPSDF